MIAPNDDKYLVFNRQEFLDNTVRASTRRPLRDIELKDAIVIRRQDLYASPALASYAANIAIAIKTTDDPKTKESLQAVADYFQRQSELAAEEGWKLPDL